VIASRNSGTPPPPLSPPPPPLRRFARVRRTRLRVEHWGQQYFWASIRGVNSIPQSGSAQMRGSMRATIVVASYLRQGKSALPVLNSPKKISTTGSNEQPVPICNQFQFAHRPCSTSTPKKLLVFESRYLTPLSPLTLRRCPHPMKVKSLRSRFAGSKIKGRQFSVGATRPHTPWSPTRGKSKLGAND
jgi:hypothetical protein